VDKKRGRARGGQDLHSVNFMQSHWILVVIQKVPGTVSAYESLSGRHPMVTLSIRKWLADEVDLYKPETQLKSFKHPKCRPQENTEDCGIFTIKNRDDISLGLDVKRMKRCTASYRRRIAVDLLATAVYGTG